MGYVREFMAYVRSGGGLGLAGQVCLILLLTASAHLAARAAVVRVRRAAGRTRSGWDDIFVDAVGRPASALIWLSGLGFAVRVAGHGADLALLQGLAPALTVGAVAVVTWFLVRLVRGVEEALVDERDTSIPTWDPTTARAAGKLVRLSILIVAALVGMQSLGLDVSGALAFGGIGGLAVGLAAKDLLANFFGGLMLHLDRPIAVGEWVASRDRDIEGVVEDIGWRLTRIRTFDKRLLFIPNSLFTTIVVANLARMTHRRLCEVVGVRHGDLAAVEPILADIAAHLRSRADVDQDEPVRVHLDAFGASSCDLVLTAFTRSTDPGAFASTKQEVLLEAARIVARHGAQLACPTHTLQVASAPPAPATSTPPPS